MAYSVTYRFCFEYATWMFIISKKNIRQIINERSYIHIQSKLYLVVSNICFVSKLWSDIRNAFSAGVRRTKDWLSAAITHYLLAFEIGKFFAWHTAGININRYFSIPLPEALVNSRQRFISASIGLLRHFYMSAKRCVFKHDRWFKEEMNVLFLTLVCCTENNVAIVLYL